MPNPTGEDELRASLQKALREKRKREEGENPPKAAEEIWIHGGPETTFEGRRGMFSKEGGFALASIAKSRVRYKRKRKDATA